MCTLLALAMQPASATPMPVWHEADAIGRAVCKPAPGTRAPLLVTIPLPDTLPPETIHCSAVTETGRKLQLVTHPAAGKSELWVTIPSPPAYLRENILVYCHTNALTQRTAPPTIDKGVSVQVRNQPGASQPNTWERFRYMFMRQETNGRNRQRVLTHSGFTPLQMPAPRYSQNVDERRHQRHHAMRPKLCRMESWVNGPEGGDYTLAIMTKDPAFLLVDDQLALSYVPAYAKNPVTNDWAATTTIPLTKGAHNLKLFTVCRRRMSTTLGWSLPSQHQNPQITDIPESAIMGSVRPEATRIEWRNNIMHPGAILTALPPYRFLDCPTTFAPLTISNWSTSWASDTPTTTWYANGHPLDLNPRSGGTAILPLDEMTQLELFAIDPLGFHTSSRFIPPRSLAVPIEYAVDLSVGNIPAVCYAEDAIWPELRLIGTAAPTIEIEIQWHIYRHGAGDAETGTTTIRRISRDRVNIPLPRVEAGTVERIEWNVIHASHAIKQGTIRFLTPPFSSLPASVDDVALLNQDNEQIVLIPHRFAGDYTQPPIHLSHAFGSLLCIDDQITIDAPAAQTPYGATLARLLDGPDRPLVSLKRIPTRNGANSPAYAPLVKFPWLASQSDEFDVVILSIAAADINALPDVETFERHTAAVSDLLSATRHQRIVWITPPPPNDAPFDIRPYAAAIQRVADARRIPVADLFSASLARYGGPTRARTGSAALPTELQELTASLVARALLADSPASTNPLTRLIP